METCSEPQNFVPWYFPASHKAMVFEDRVASKSLVRICSKLVPAFIFTGRHPQCCCLNFQLWQACFTFSYIFPSTSEDRLRLDPLVTHRYCYCGCTRNHKIIIIYTLVMTSVANWKLPFSSLIYL